MNEQLKFLVEKANVDRAGVARVAYDFGRQAEQERIIKLLIEAKAEELTPEQALAKGWQFNEPAGIWWLPQEALVALIKGENNE